MRRVFACVIACALMVSCLCGCTHEPKAGQGFRFPLSAEPRELDPQTATDDAARVVLDVLFEGLCAMQDGVVVPAAADWTASSDGLTYVFTLFSSAWSNGDPVTADDFLFAYQRTMDAATASPHAAAFEGVGAVEAVDANTLRVTLTAADPQFPAAIAGGVWYPCPRAFFEQCGGGWGMERDALITNGAFRLSSWNHGQSLLLKKNEGYHAAADIAPSAVRFVIGEDETAASIAAGKLDGCMLARGDTADGVAVTDVADSLSYLWFNTTVSPLSSAAVRRGLRDAVEWDTVNAALSGEPTVSYVSGAARVGGAAYDSPLSLRQTAADRAAFADALSAAGMSACPTLTLLCEGGEESLRLAQYIAQSWQKNLALYFTIEQLPASDLTARLTAGNYHLAIAPATARGGSPADALLLFDGSAADGNWARYQNAAWAASVRAADSAAALADAELALSDACPAVPLAVVTRRFGLAEDVEGVAIEPFTSRFDFRHARR